MNLVYDVFECKNYLTFTGGSFAAFAKLRTEPYGANPCVKGLCNFCRSDFERDPSPSSFTLGMTVDNKVGSDADCVK